MINTYLLVLPFAFILMALLGIWIVSPGKPDKRIHGDYVSIPRKHPRVSTDAFGNIHIEPVPAKSAKFVRVPKSHRLEDNSTQQHYWKHPLGHPYQVYGGPLGGDDMPTSKPYAKWEDVWTDSPILPGYRLIMGEYDDRLFHVPSEDTPQ